MYVCKKQNKTKTPQKTCTPTSPFQVLIHTSFSPLLLIITYTAGTLHFIASILSLQGWQAGHKLSWRWGWKLEEIVMKISSVCRSGHSCSCHKPCAGGITPGQHVCMYVGVLFTFCICVIMWARVSSYGVRRYTSRTHVSLCTTAFVPVLLCRLANVYSRLAR